MDCIINADGFGLSENVDQAIVRGFSEGVIQRTSLRVNTDHAEQAAELARKNGFFGFVGLRLDFSEGRALTPECRANRSLCDASGVFTRKLACDRKKRGPLDRMTLHALETEAEAQIRRFLDLGFPLRHADSSDGLHTDPAVAGVLLPLLARYGFTSIRAPRNLSGEKLSCREKRDRSRFGRIQRRCGLCSSDYFGSFEDYRSFSRNHPYREGKVELMTHPVLLDGVLTDDTDGKKEPFLTRRKAAEARLQLTPLDDHRTSLLVVFDHDHIGGVATSMASFLSSLDYSRFKVDLLYYEYTERNPLLPPEVILLPQAKQHKDGDIGNALRKACDPRYVAAYLRAQYAKRVKHNKVHAVQIRSAQGCRYSRRLQTHYDVAVSYDLTWCMNYMMRYVKADRKYIWHHDDYEAIGYKIREDRRQFDRCSGLVFVSTQCRDKFARLYPEYASRCFYMPNITASAPLKVRAEEPVSLPFVRKDGVLYLLTVARVVFSHKGMDRVIRAFCRLREEGLLDRLVWTVIGDGDDFDALSSMISENHLEENVYLLGKKTNPIPYLKLFDVFLLPSHYEGKPIAITEAQIMGLVPAVTRYTSAAEQIENGVDGLIFDNTDEALYEGLRELALRPGQLGPMREKLNSRVYSNEKDIECFYQIISEN